MKQPGTITYLFGNPLSLLLAFGVLLLTGWGWLANTMSGWLCLAALIALLAAGKCHRRLTAYRQWQREWEGMTGKQADGTSAALRRALRYPIAIGIWLVGLVFSFGMAGDSSLAWAVWLYWLGSAGLLIYAALRLAQHIHSVKHAEVQDRVVSICARVPLQSPSVGETCSVLPRYCIRLFGW